MRSARRRNNFYPPTHLPAGRQGIPPRHGGVNECEIFLKKLRWMFVLILEKADKPCEAPKESFGAKQGHLGGATAKAVGLHISFYLIAVIFLSSGFSSPQSSWEKIQSGILEPDINVIESPASAVAQVYFASARALYRATHNKVDANVNLGRLGGAEEVHAIYAPAQSFGTLYVATDNGLYKGKEGLQNWERIFQSFDPNTKNCLAVVTDDKKVYLGTAKGFFSKEHADANWQKARGALSDQPVYFLAADNNFLYLATGEEIFKLDKQTSEFNKIFSLPAATVERSESSPEEAFVENGNGETLPQIKALELISAEPPYLFTATRKGVFYSADQGKTWQALAIDSLPVDELNSLAVFKDLTGLPGGECGFQLGNACYQILAGTKRGLFQYQKGLWVSLYQGLESNTVRDLAYDSEGNVYCATDRGVFFVAAKKTLPFENLPFPGSVDYGQLKNNFAQEPSVMDVQRLAIRYADVGRPKIESWKKRAAYKAILPTVSVGLDRAATEYFHWDSGQNPDVLLKGRDFMDWDVSVSWDFGDLIWNSDQTSIDSRSKLMVELREDILDQVTRLYFERRRIQMELAALKETFTPDLAMDREMRLEELTALLDGFTGGAFSELIERRKRSQKPEVGNQSRKSEKVRGE